MQIPMDLISRLEDAWGLHPVMVVACLGGADMHLQIWHPYEREAGEGAPCYIVHPDGKVEAHPDADLAYM